MILTTFILNSLAQSATKSDAFEVFVNGDLVFSKLEQKRMPMINEILEALALRGIGVASTEITMPAGRKQTRKNEM